MNNTATSKFFTAVWQSIAIIILVYIGMAAVILFLAEGVPASASLWSWVDKYDPNPTFSPSLSRSVAFTYNLVSAFCSGVNIVRIFCK